MSCNKVALALILTVIYMICYYSLLTTKILINENNHDYYYQIILQVIRFSCLVYIIHKFTQLIKKICDLFSCSRRSYLEHRIYDEENMNETTDGEHKELLLNTKQQFYETLETYKKLVCSKNETLEDRIEKYEHQTLMRHTVNNDEHFIVRLSGHNFTKFINTYFKNNNIEVYNKLMLDISDELLKELNPKIIHVQNKEINLVFTNINNNNNYQYNYNGSVAKILASCSAIATSKFFTCMNKLIKTLDNEKYKKLKQQYNDGLINVYFDSKMLILPQDKDYEIINYLYLRSVVYGYNNLVLNRGTNNAKNHNKFGWFIKKSFSMYHHSVKNHCFTRKESKAVSLKIKYSDKLKNVLLSDTWNEPYLLSLDNLEILNSI